MRITYFGHSAFLVQAVDGTRVILDPYRHGSYNGAVKYEPIDEPADVALASHNHPDHSATSTIPGHPRVFASLEDETVGGVRIIGIEVAHDDVEGKERGKSTLTVLDDGDLRLVHCGDLGHVLDADTIREIGRVDILLIPVGGFYTIDHEQAALVVETLGPRIVVPMHYKTDKIDFPIATADPFLATQAVVERPDSSVLEVTKATLPSERVTIVLPHSQ
jgi:L-ascorbate metabolism protein UlaG (beta-lactamase superfamily)